MEYADQNTGWKSEYGFKSSSSDNDCVNLIYKFFISLDCLVIGEWCNLGAGTSNSNLRNTASNVKVWSKKQNDFIEAGLKCGLLMGDYSRSAINSSFNTGTVVGVGANYFSPGLSAKHIPSFSWANEKYQFDKAIKDIANWKKLKGQELSEKEIQTLQSIFENS